MGLTLARAQLTAVLRQQPVPVDGVHIEDIGIDNLQVTPGSAVLTGKRTLRVSCTCAYQVFL